MQIHLPRGLPSRQAQFLCLLAARPSLTRADYQRLLHVSHNTAQRDLTQLTRATLVLPRGNTKDRRYTLHPNTLNLGQNPDGSARQDQPTIPITIAPLSLP